MQASDHKGCSERRGRQIETLGSDLSRLVFSLLETVFFGTVLSKDLSGLQAAQYDSSQYVCEQPILHSEKGY